MTKEMVLDCEFLILNRIPGLYSAQRFRSEIKRLNLNAELVTPEWFIESVAHFETRGLSLGVLYRQGDFNFWPTQTSLAKMPFRILNSPDAFLEARDKWMTARTWQTSSIPMPLTFLLTDLVLTNLTHDLNATTVFLAIQKKFGLPFMLKKRFSSQGHGVFLIKDLDSFISVMEQDTHVFRNSNAREIDYFRREANGNKSLASPTWIQYRRWLAQSCVQECLGYDVRVFCVSGNYFAIERRNDNSFRSNLHQGGQAVPTTLTATERVLCETIHKQSQLNYSGIDFLRSQQGPLFLEINPSPGFEGIEQVYNHNIAADLLGLFKS